MTDRDDKLFKAVEEAGFDELKEENQDNPPKTVSEILADCGLARLTATSSSEDVKAALQSLSQEAVKLYLPDRILIHQAAKEHLKTFMGSRPAEKLLNSYLKSECKTNPGRVRFDLRENGLYRVTVDESGNSRPEYVCSPIRVLGATRDPENRAWGRLVEFKDLEGQSKIHNIRMADLIGEALDVRKTLADAGLILSPHSKAAEWLREYLTFNAENLALVRTTTKTGWEGGSFVLPHNTVSPDKENGESTFFESSGISLIRTSGTHEYWQQEVGELCRGNSLLQFIVGVNLAATLLEVVGEENGGFHCRGGSSIGKTTALLVGGSVNGGGARQGFVRAWKATDNGIEGLAVEHNDLCLSLDELSQADPKHVGESAYLLGNGTEKVRMRASGELRKQRRFRILFLSSGEISLEEHAKSVGKNIRGGQEARVIDLPGDAGKGYGIFEDIHDFPSPGEFSRHLQEKAKTFYGTPLLHFLQFVVNHREELAGEIREYRSAFIKKSVPASASGEVSRICGRFGLVAAALLLAAKAGTVPWKQNEVKWAVKTIWERYLLSRGTYGARDMERAVRQVAIFIQTYGTSRFEDGEDPDEYVEEQGPHGDPGNNTSEAPRTRPRVVINRAGFRYMDNKGDWQYWFHADVFREEICVGFNASAVAKELKERGFLITETDTRYTHQKRVKGLGKPYFYVVNSKILEVA